MRSLLKVALLVVAGILVYNYFLGTPEEKETSEKVFRQVKEVGKSIGDLIKKERQKFRDGKYDKAFDKLEEAYQKLKGTMDASSNSEEKERLDMLERKRDELIREKEELQKELEKENPDEEIVRKSPSFEEELNDLVKETGKLLDQVMKRRGDRQ